MLPLIACSRCTASGRVRDAELVPLDQQGQPRADAVVRRLVEELPPGPIVPCPVCHGHRLTPRRGHRPYPTERAAERARGRGTTRPCIWCEGSGLAGWVAVWQPCTDCQGRGRVLGWMGDVDPVVPDGVDLEQPVGEHFMRGWLATVSWTVVHQAPPRGRKARAYTGSGEWARERLTYSIASLVSVWAPDAGWETATDQALIGCARSLLAARSRPLTISRLTSLRAVKRVSTRLQVEVLGSYGWRITLLLPPAPPSVPVPERPWVALPSAAVTRWMGLDPHARVLLAALYDEDQQREHDEDVARRDDFAHHRPAAAWRWIDLDDPAIAKLLRQAGLGGVPLAAVITALAEQRLVDHRAGTGHGTVQLTRLGRQTVRAGRREPPRGRPPQHLLPGGAWSTLAQLYDAGDEGLDRSRYGGHHGSSSLVPLQAHRDGPLVEHFEVPQPIGQPTQRVRLTAAGRAFHQRAWAEHDCWYPGVRATPPPGIKVVTLPPLGLRPEQHEHVGKKER